MEVRAYSGPISGLIVAVMTIVIREWQLGKVPTNLVRGPVSEDRAARLALQ